MKTIPLDQVAKSKMAMEGAKDVYKQLPISKADGTPSFFFGYLPLNREAIPPTMPMNSST